MTRPSGYHVERVRIATQLLCPSYGHLNRPTPVPPDGGLVDPVTGPDHTLTAGSPECACSAADSCTVRHQRRC